MKDNKRIQSFNEHQENLNISDVMNSILSELRQELSWYNEDEAKTQYTQGVKHGRQQAMELAMEVVQKYCS